MLAKTAETRAIATPAKTKIEGILNVLCHSADDQGISCGTGDRIVKYLKSVSAGLGGKTVSDIPTAFSYSAKKADAENLSLEEKYGLALQATVSYARDSSNHLQKTLAETVGKETVVSVGGNHLRAVELIGYLRECKRRGREPVVVWCDAHPDAHTPDTSDTKNLHGMVAMLLFGKGPKGKRP
jgi:arginase family enzyme